MAATIQHVDLPITGMTCASCANRIERRLNKLEGVSASVNYATETASVQYATDIEVAAAGRHRRSRRLRRRAAHRRRAATTSPPSRWIPTAALRRRLIICALLSIPVLAMSMISPLQFDNWQWLSLQLATPVVLWGAWPFHRAAWANLKHATATMDTLISVGTLAAWLWSLYALFIGDAGMNEMRMTFELIPSSGGGANEIYLETAAIVTTFILAGRYFEARAKRRAGAALKALLELGAKDVAKLGPDGTRAARADRRAAPRRPLRRAARREDRHRRDRRGGPLGRRHEHADRRVGPGRGRSRLRRRGRHHQRRGPARRPGHPRRQRDRARADRQAGDRRADRQGARPAACRPGLGHLRPGRLRDRHRHARLLAGRGSERDVRVHRGRRRADHRLPVRSGPGHADRADGRHRPRARSWACSSRAPRSSSPRDGSTRSCSTRPAP